MTADAALGLETAHIPLADLNSYHRNPRRGDIDTIAESLQKLGQYRPIVVNRGTHTGRPNEVLAGNHTLAAARKLDWHTIAVSYVDVDDDTAARIVVVDNRSNELASNDDQMLADLLTSLPDLDATGYNRDQLDALLSGLAPTEDPVSLTDPDDAPGIREDTISQPGDVWKLGPHRLAVGDSTDPNVWDALLAGGKADCMWTDPPYGVAYVGKTKDALTIENDTKTGDELADFLRGALALAATKCQPGAVWYVASPAGPLFLPFAQVLTELDVWRQTLVWAKDQFVMGRSDYHYRHEAIFYGWTPGAAHQPPPDRKQDTIHEVPRPKRSKDHPTMKPVELIERHLENSTNPGHTVVDPFGGSGSTLIAAHRTSRVARLIELDPRYADVILRRYTEHTGNTPVREGTGDTYDIPTGG